mgnify:CR=1 FL=1
MPKNNQKPKSRKNRRASTPNVFVQNRNVEDEDQSAQDTSATTTDITTPRTRTRVRVERATRSASVRSEIYTRSQSAELKKLAGLTFGIIIVLSVLTFVL